MKQKKKQRQVEIIDENHESICNEKQHEIYKAVAQAWHSHFNNEKVATSEFDARRRNFQSKPSRFKLELMVEMVRLAEKSKVEWDFKESLWDSYEIVTVSKRLENGLVMGCDNSCDLEKIGEFNRVFRRRKESKNSLRTLFNVMSSRRFNDD